MIVNRN